MAHKKPKIALDRSRGRGTQSGCCHSASATEAISARRPYRYLAGYPAILFWMAAKIIIQFWRTGAGTNMAMVAMMKRRHNARKAAGASRVTAGAIDDAARAPTAAGDALSALGDGGRGRSAGSIVECDGLARSAVDVDAQGNKGTEEGTRPEEGSRQAIAPYGESKHAQTLLSPSHASLGKIPLRPLGHHSIMQISGIIAWLPVTKLNVQFGLVNPDQSRLSLLYMAWSSNVLFAADVVKFLRSPARILI